MTPREYLTTAKKLNGSGDHRYVSDGCTMAGIVHKLWPQAEAACWGHDYGRRGYMGFIRKNGLSQKINDRVFRLALQQTGVPHLLSWIMWVVVRIQYITGMSPLFMAGAMTALIFAVFIFIFE